MDYFRLDTLILTILWVAAMPVGAFAFIHALLQRADAFTAANRLSKPVWVGITAAATAGLVLFRILEPGFVLWLAALIAALVYIVDVRPKLIEVQRRNKR